MMVSVSYYRDLLNKESTTIAELCDKWQKILNDSEQNSAIPDEACGKIHVAVGQAQLLIRLKFEQFRGLIDLCGNEESIKEVTVQDLQGFWELVYIQVQDIYSKFQEVDKLQEDNWEPGTTHDMQRQPLGNLNKSISNSGRQKTLVVKKDFSAQAKERLAQAKALARKRLENSTAM